jgi:hypothetical protein
MGAMKNRRSGHFLGLLALALAAASCQTGGGGLEPIVIDLSKPKATPAATATPPFTRPSPTAAAAPAVPTPAPAAPVASSAPPASVSSDAGRESDAPRAVDARIDAFNRHDLDALVASYAHDARIYDPPDRVRDAGLDGIRSALARELGASAAGPISVRDRLVQGAFVVERESRGDWTALVAYEIRDGRIANVWILR